jgi:hypothetical protein
LNSVTADDDTDDDDPGTPGETVDTDGRDKLAPPNFGIVRLIVSNDGAV